MRRRIPFRVLVSIAFSIVCFPICCAAEKPTAPPACGSNKYAAHYLIPGPGEPGHDTALALKARRYDRQFHVFNALPMAVNADVIVPAADAASRALIEKFITGNDGWDFAAVSGGKTAYDVITGWHKTAGLYAGVGIAADAFRYAVLREQGGDCHEIKIARAHLFAALDAMHLAFTIPGRPGVVARGFLKKNMPGDARVVRTMPLRDAKGNPLPTKKNNGTWREDGSGLYPDYIWEDSISRDQMLGWAMATAATMEIIRDDPSFGEAVKQRLRADAAGVCRAMRAKRASGYDLEFPDADGRTTFFGHLNENNLDGDYLPGLQNGFYAMMALGIYAAYAYAAEDAELDRHLYDTLIKKRHLPAIAERHMKFVDMGAGSNFSNWNMAFTSVWLAVRYIKDENAVAQLRRATESALYDNPRSTRQPIEMKQSLFDLVFAAAETQGTAFAPPAKTPDAAPLERAMETLREFPAPPFFESPRENCDKEEIATKDCVLDDGTRVKLLGNVGWQDELVADRPIPMRVRPHSNYYWRSNPYAPNGGGADRMIGGVDFRVAYWLGRWTRVP